MNLGELTSVKDMGAVGLLTRFNSQNESVAAINIKEWDELIRIIISMNPAVKIKRLSKVGRIIAKWINPINYTILICFFVSILDLAGIEQYKIKTNLAPVIVALEKYKTANNHYPDKLEELTPTYLDALPRTAYYVDASGEYLIGRSVTIFSKHFYRSRTKKWTTED